MGGCQQDFPTIAHAMDYGDSYQLGRTTIERIYEVYESYAGWIDAYRGAITPLSVASGMSWESRGNPYKFKAGATISEIGLMSLTLGVAKNLDVDPFDPEANIWAGCYLRNDRAREIVEDPKYNWLVDADPYNWTEMTYKLPGSLGMGGWRTIMNLAFPVPPPTGSPARIYPYLALLDWVSMHPERVPRLGNMEPTLVACRIARHHDVDFLAGVDQLHVPGVYQIIPRPAHLPRWSPSKFDAVVDTPVDLRASRFPEYNRFPPGSPGAPARGGTGRIIAGVLASLGALSGIGYVLWRKYG